MRLSFNQSREAIKSSRCLFYQTCSRLLEPWVRNARNKTNDYLSGIYYMLDKTKVACERSFLYPDPLHRLNRILSHLRAGFHHISHFRDGNHLETAWVDTAHASGELFYVREFMSFQIDRTRWAFTLKNLKHEKRRSFIKVLDQFVCQSENKLALHARLYFESPEFRVFVARQSDVSNNHLSDLLLVVRELILHNFWITGVFVAKLIVFKLVFLKLQSTLLHLGNEVLV